MTHEKLPDGLQLAVNALVWHSVGCDGYKVEIDAIRAEHAKRLMLQHHAADQAQRVADLETERDGLRLANAEWAPAADFARSIQSAANLGDHCGNVLVGAIKQISAERDELRARLADLERQEPVAISKGGNLFWAGNPQDHRGVDCALYARTVPAQAVPMSDERIDAIAELVIKGMPDGILGFARGWGWQQFARDLLIVCAGHYRPVPAVPADPGMLTAGPEGL